MNRVFQNSLRLLIAGGSVLGFVGGWALLAHSGKPVAVDSPPAQMAPATLPRAGSFFRQNPAGLQPLQPSPFQSGPRFSLRTGGS